MKSFPVSVLLVIALCVTALSLGYIVFNVQDQSPLTLVSTQQVAQVASTLPSGALASWSFDAGSGTTAADSVGGNTLSFVGSPTWVAGRTGGALSFNGAGAALRDSSLAVSGSAVTVSFWLNNSTWGTSQTELVELSDNSNNVTTGFGIYVNDTPSCAANQLSVAIKGDAGYNASCYATPGAGAWHHYAFVLDKSQAAASEIKLYIDGSFQPAAKQLFTSNNTNSFAPGSFNVMTRAGEGSPTFSGIMDDLSIYSRALSASEVASIVSYTGTTGGGTGGTTTPPPTPTDTTAPVISAISAAGITTTGANISWTTDESADTQIEYGLTSSYGSNTTAVPTLSTSHSQSLSGLQSGTVYHYRVRSKDAAGNQGVSVDQTFTTTAVVTANQAPVVSLALSASTIASTGSVTLTANATDPDGSIARVELYNGPARIANIVNAPYTFTWKNIPVGVYTLSALAYDNKGATGVSTLQALKVSNVVTQPTSYSVTVTKSGTGTGTVVSTGSINCGTVCSANGTAGQTVNLTATPAAGSTFGGWSITPTAPIVSGCTNTSTTCSFTLNANTIVGASFNRIDISTPSVPSNLTATAVSSSQINLSWTASVDSVGVTGYQVFRNGVQIANITPAATTFQNTSGLLPATTYSYTVRAYNAAGTFSAQSAAASATTQSGVDGSAPTAPTNLVAIAVTSTQINLSWTASIDNVGVTKYNITRNGTLLTTVTGTSYVNTGLTASTLYTYTVTASDAASNTSAPSQSASATTLATPSYSVNVTKSGTGTGTVTSAGSINCGTSCSSTGDVGMIVTLTATPASGSSFGGWSITPTAPIVSGCTPTSTTCSFTLNANTTVNAVFNTVAVQTYTITTSAGANGTISPASATVNSGASQTFTITPATGYQITSVLVDNTSVGAVSSYTFSNVTAPHTISATFSQVSCTTCTSFYVTPSGAGLKNGSSWANAFANTTGIAWASIPVGATIYLDGGTSGASYSAFSTGKSGTAAARITIARSTEAGHDGVVTIASPVQIGNSYITIDGRGWDKMVLTANMTVKGDAGHGGALSISGDNNEVKYMRFNGDYSQGNSDHNINCFASCNTLLVQYNDFYKTAGEDHINWRGNKLLTIDHNVFTTPAPPNDGAHRDLMNPDSIPGGYDLYFTNNIVYGLATNGFAMLFQNTTAVGNIHVYRNVFATSPYVMRFGSGNMGAQSIEFHNNVFYNTQDSLVAPGATHKNDIFYGPGMVATDVHEVNGATTNSLWYNTGAFQSGAGNISNANPLFIDVTKPLGADGIPFTADDGFNLRSGSPAINAGAVTGETKDIIGGVMNGTPDIGAYEYSGTVNPQVDGNSPTAPTNLVATAISSSQINLSWTASIDNVGVDHYNVMRSIGTAAPVQIATVTGTSYVNTGLAASTQYTYTVSATDAATNTSAPSLSASVTTQGSANPTSTKFIVGNQVAVSGTGTFLNIRATPSTAGTSLGTKTDGSTGTVATAPAGTVNGVSADGYYWWYVNFGTVTGWAAETYLIPYSNPGTGSIHFITPNGSGSRNGSDWNNAFAGIPSSFVAGDTYYMAGGSYGTLSVTGSGAAGRVVSIRRASSANPQVIGAAGWSPSFDSTITAGGINLAGSYVTLSGETAKGIYINNNGTAVVIGASSVGATLAYVEITASAPAGSASQGIYINGASNFTLDHAVIHGQVNGMQIMRMSNSVIQYSEFYDINAHGTTGHPNVNYILVTTNSIWRYNKIHNNDALGIAWEDGSGDDNNYLYGNLFYNDTGAHNGIESDSNRTGLGRFYIYNNTFVNEGATTINFRINPAGGEIANNIFLNSGGLSPQAASVPNSNNVTSASLVSSTDFHLRSGIPGKSLTADGFINKDMDGRIRGADGVWDVGAYEF